MELKAFRRSRVQEAMKDSNVQILIASLPQNIAYLTGGYVSVGQNVLCSSQAYVAYLLPEDRLYYIVGHAEIPSVLEFEGGNAEIVPFGAFRFAYGWFFRTSKYYSVLQARLHRIFSFSRQLSNSVSCLRIALVAALIS